MGGLVPDREFPRANRRSLLLREDRSELQRSCLGLGLDAEGVGGYAGGDESGGGSAERDVAHFDAPQNLVLETLVKHVDVVVRAELPLRVEIHIHVDPITHDATGAHQKLLVEGRGREPALASQRGIVHVGRRAAFVSEPVHLQLQSGPHVQTEVRVTLHGLDDFRRRRLALTWLRKILGSGDVDGAPRPRGSGRGAKPESDQEALVRTVHAGLSEEVGRGLLPPARRDHRGAASAPHAAGPQCRWHPEHERSRRRERHPHSRWYNGVLLRRQGRNPGQQSQEGKHQRKANSHQSIEERTVCG